MLSERCSKGQKVTPRSNIFAHLHSLTYGPTKHQLSTLYDFQDVVKTRFHGSRLLVKIKDQVKVSPKDSRPTIPTNNHTEFLSTSYTLLFLRYSPEKILKVRVTILKSKVKSNQSDTMRLHTYSPQAMSYIKY